MPHIALLADPCYGGVTASYATVADVVLAEPGALIGFAGPRVIEQITRQVPEGFQTAEFLLAHGMIDMIVPRGNSQPPWPRSSGTTRGPRHARQDALPEIHRSLPGQQRSAMTETPPLPLRSAP